MGYLVENPDLVLKVDFIAVHILPFWEGIAADDAVDYVFDDIMPCSSYPNKPVIHY